jgi:eukaryotic-like serine/threonine-protein kinase
VIVLAASPPETRVAGRLLDDLVSALGEPAAPEDHATRVALEVARGARDAGDPHARAVGAAPGALHRLAVDALVRRLRHAAARRPLCLIVDDAQWCDRVLLDAGERLAGSDEPCALFVCLLSRPVPGERHAAARTLAPLPAADAVTLVQRLLAHVELPLDAARAIAERSGGSPLLIVESVRALSRQALVRRERHAPHLLGEMIAGTHELPLLDWIAERHLSALPVELAAHARLASLLGPDFSTGEMQGVLAELDTMGHGLDFPFDAHSAIERLASAGLLITRDARHGFRHALLREAIAATLPQSQRTRVHLAAARVLRDRLHPGDERGRYQLAVHASASGQPQEALLLFAELAESARTRHAYLDAELLYTRVLTLAGDAQQGLVQRATHGRAVMRYRTGRHLDALADFQAAARLARTAGDGHALALVLLDQATALDWLDQLDESQRCVEEAEQAAGAHPDPSLQVGLSMAHGRSAWRRSDLPRARALLARAAQHAEALGDAAYEQRIASLLMLGHLLPMLGETAQALEVFDAALCLARDKGDRLHLAAVYNNRFNLWSVCREFARGIADQEQFIVLSRELALWTNEQHGRYNVAWLRHKSGDLAGAEAELARLDTLFERHAPEPAFAAAAAALRCLVWCARGSHQAAAELIASTRAGTLLPFVEVQLAIAELVVRDAGRAAWEALEARARSLDLTDELDEIHRLAPAPALRAS